jgi:hypothetical protein
MTKDQPESDREVEAEDGRARVTLKVDIVVIGPARQSTSRPIICEGSALFRTGTSSSSTSRRSPAVQGSPAALL